MIFYHFQSNQSYKVRLKKQVRVPLSCIFSMAKSLLIFIIFHIFVSTTVLSSQAGDLSKVALRIKTSDGSISSASFVKYGNKPNITYFLITSYHCILKQKEIEISHNGSQYFNINEFIELNNPLFIDAALDLAVFRCSEKGQKMLIEKLGRIPLKMVKKRPYYLDVRTVGNPELDMIGAKSTAINHPAWTCISEYPRFGMRLPQRLARGNARNTTIMILESLHVLYGYSGGPVVVSQSGFKNPDYEFAGIIQGGIPGEWKSWAIPCENIKKSINSALEKNRFIPYPQQEQEWPEPLFNYEDVYFKQSSSPFYFEVIERIPTVEKAGTTYLKFLPNEVNRISLTLRILGSGKELKAVLSPQEWFEIVKIPPVIFLGSDGGFVSVEWEIKPAQGIVGDKKLKINFYSSKKDQDFSLELKARLSKRPLKNNLYNISFNFISTTDLKKRWAPGLSFYRRINNIFAVGFEIGYQLQRIPISYEVLSGFPKSNIEKTTEDIYYGGLFHFTPNLIKNKNIEPYTGIVIGFPFNSQLRLGLGLKISRLFELGVETRIIYYKSKTPDIIFNNYGDAIEEPKTEHKVIFSLGLKIGLNFKYKVFK